MKPVHFPCRVYYENTEAAGIVYYAAYLKFIERARTELLRSLGHDHVDLMRQNIAFAVRSLQIDYLRPAKLDDLLTVESRIDSLGRAQLVFFQSIFRDKERLLDATIRIACIDPSRGKAIAMPATIHRQFQSLLAET